jgi:hypothetical protein
MWVLIGAFIGLVVGAILGAYVANTGGGDIQELNDLAGVFVAGVGLVIGALGGLIMGLTNRSDAHDEPPTGTRPIASFGSESQQGPRLPFPPPSEPSPPLEHESEADPDDP